MRYFLFLPLFFLNLNTNVLKAQDTLSPQNKSSHIALGIQMSSFGQDFGWGLHLTSPYFAKERLAVRLSAQYQYYEHVDTSKNTVWSPYWAFDLGLVSASAVLLDFLRLYSHTGAIVALPNAQFSSKVVAFGAFSKLGIELMFSSNQKAWGSYFIEGGWVGIFSAADKLPNAPIYGNGFLASTGVRFYF